MNKYIVFLIQTFGIFLFGLEYVSLIVSSKTEIGFIVPTPEQNYNNLMEVASGIKSVKVSQLHKRDDSPLESVVNVESQSSRIDMVSEEEKKIESPEIIQKKIDVEPVKDDQQVKSIEKSPKPRLVEKPKKEKTSEKRELSCSTPEKMGSFPFKPFAETARAVGIPAYSSYKAISDLHTSFNGVLDSTTLLELYYFDYDKLAIKRPNFDGKEDAWISKSLLSLIYKSEQEDPLSFLMLGYGITSTHWESYIPQDDLETPEIVVEDIIQEHDHSHGDIIFKN
ncbi:uncharacterized protein cubi_02244 [Cryptosporidium ubiquitum]|uniref:Uncharacterized protein n=1 Tax=Cryptosporidium ubiquitum TaxID=857276 RepID=A0A1J4MJI1_9CRYT|nr:uncharacterized protein cubi_02244 [Cryptosporidium ubiquitum]OII73013.1 hypothetical protein cubi_02244 [Cryptosporidium ubiquitum]